MRSWFTTRDASPPQIMPSHNMNLQSLGGVEEQRGTKDSHNTRTHSLLDLAAALHV